MVYKLFAAIHIGSGEVSMKVYQMSRRGGVKRIDAMKSFIQLGGDTYRKGYIDHDTIFELCRILEGCRRKLDEYKIKENYLAYATGALCEADNCRLIIDNIRIRTGLTVQPVSNSQQRFLILKSLSVNMPEFEKLIDEGVSFIDVGAGSMQLTIYEGGKLILSQNLKLGSMRIREILSDVESRSSDFGLVINDYIGNDIDTVSLFYKEHPNLKNMVFSGEEIGPLLKILYGTNDSDKALSLAKLKSIYDSVYAKTADELARDYSIPYEVADLIKSALAVYMSLIEVSGAERLFTSNAELLDGTAWTFYDDNFKVKPIHDFTEDIVNYARVIAANYHTNSAHTGNVEYLSLAIFDAMKKVSGLTPRDRLLLQLSCILHDSGKFINMKHGTDNSFYIVMGMDTFGISEQERRVAADVIKYNSWPYVPESDELEAPLSPEDYVRMLKLTSILRLANAIDRSHRQKITKVSVSLKEKKLVIRADSIYDITLEQNMVDDKGVFFEEVYGYKPHLRKKRR